MNLLKDHDGKVKKLEKEIKQKLKIEDAHCSNNLSSPATSTEMVSLVKINVYDIILQLYSLSIIAKNCHTIKIISKQNDFPLMRITHATFN